MNERVSWGRGGGKVSSQHSVGRAIAGVTVGGAGSRKKSCCANSLWRRWPGWALKVWEEGGGNFTPKEQQVERLRVRRAGGRRQESLA